MTTLIVPGNQSGSQSRGQQAPPLRGTCGLDFELLLKAVDFFGRKELLKSLETSNPQLIETLMRNRKQSAGVIHASMRADAESARNYVRGLIINSNTKRASTYLKDLKLNFNEVNEKKVVELGYVKAAYDAAVILDNGRSIQRDTIRKFTLLRELTGINMPQDVHEKLLAKITELQSSNIQWIEQYLDAVGGLVVPQQLANKLYENVCSNAGAVVDLSHALMLYQKINKRPDDALVLGKLKDRFMTLLKMDNFPKYLPVITKLAKDDPRTDVENFINENSNVIPICGKVALKLAYKIPLLDGELDAAYAVLTDTHGNLTQGSRLKMIKEDVLRNMVFALVEEGCSALLRKEGQNASVNPPTQ